MAEIRMELIKKIKQAEAEAQGIIERAKVETAQEAEKGREKRHERVLQAERERKKAIEASEAAAESAGLAESAKLKEQAEKVRQRLREDAAGKMAGATAKVMDYLKG